MGRPGQAVVGAAAFGSATALGVIAAWAPSVSLAAAGTAGAVLVAVLQQTIP